LKEAVSNQQSAISYFESTADLVSDSGAKNEERFAFSNGALREPSTAVADC
jgi:hypothetical protein